MDVLTSAQKKQPKLIEVDSDSVIRGSNMDVHERTTNRQKSKLGRGSDSQPDLLRVDSAKKNILKNNKHEDSGSQDQNMLSPKASANAPGFFQF